MMSSGWLVALAPTAPSMAMRRAGGRYMGCCHGCTGKAGYLARERIIKDEALGTRWENWRMEDGGSALHHGGWSAGCIMVAGAYLRMKTGDCIMKIKKLVLKSVWVQIKNHICWGIWENEVGRMHYYDEIVSRRIFKLSSSGPSSANLIDGPH